MTPKNYKLNVDDLILHKNFPGEFRVTRIISDGYFRIQSDDHDDGNSFHSADRFIKQILTREENPEYFL